MSKPQRRHPPLSAALLKPAARTAVMGLATPSWKECGSQEPSEHARRLPTHAAPLTPTLLPPHSRPPLPPHPDGQCRQGRAGRGPRTLWGTCHTACAAHMAHQLDTPHSWPVASLPDRNHRNCWERQHQSGQLPPDLRAQPSGVPPQVQRLPIGSLYQ